MSPLDEQIIALREAGLKLKEIGAEVGLSHVAVLNHLKALGRARRDPHKKPAPDRKHQTKTRNCLRCSAKMISSWAGERVCRKCKDSSTWRGGTLEW